MTPAGEDAGKPAWEVCMRRFLIALTGLALVVSACAQQPPPGGAATTAPTAAATAGPVRGGTFIFAMWQEPTTLAPLYVNQTIAGLVGDVITEGLARTDNDGNYVPWLAKSIPTVNNGKVRVSGTKMEVEWELQAGLKWSDGKPVTSQDIVFTWQTWMKDPKVVNRAGFSEIEAIDTPNDTTAIVKYKSIYAPYFLNFGGLMPKHLLTGVEDISKHDYNRKPLGTGPYMVTDFKAGDSITVERNPNYRVKDKPYLDKIIFKSVPSSEVAIAQLKAGEVHGMWNLLESQTVDLEKDTNLKIIVTPSPSVERIEINTAVNKDQTDPNSVHPVLGDIAMRKALLWATPKQQLIDKLLFGKAKAGSSPVSQGWAAYKEAQDGYDPAKANAELDKAGWVKGADGIRSKGGARASLTIVSTTGNQTRERVEQVLVDEYKQIGVELKIQNQPSAVFLSGSWAASDPRKRGSFDLAMYASSPGIDPHVTVSTRYHSKQIPSAANNGVGQNYTRFKDPEADKAIDEAGATLDLEKRKAAYAKALKLLNQAYVIIWLYDRANIDAHRINVGGWQGNVWDEVTWNVEDWFLKKS
jgi:peptide/nickel transport system substrate-binding protein